MNEDLQHPTIESVNQEQIQAGQIAQEEIEPLHQSRTLTDEELDNLKTHVVNDAKGANKILLGGALLALAIVVIKILHLGNVVSWNGLSVPLGYAWFIFILLTFWHFYQGCLVLVYSAYDLWRANSLKYGQAAFQEILNDQNPFVNRLRPRTRYLGKFPLRTYAMNDLPAFVSIIAVIFLLAAIVPWDVSNLKRFLVLAVGAILIIIANWLIGATWIVAISELTEEHNNSTYHKRLEQKMPHEGIPDLVSSGISMDVERVLRKNFFGCFGIVLAGIATLIIFWLTS